MLSQTVSRVVGATALMLGSFSSQAGLILNGDFEANAGSTGNNSWKNSRPVEGWEGSSIEVWRAMKGVTAASGNHFIELSAHGSNSGDWSIFQTFVTNIGQQYELSFFYRARNHDKEQFAVSLADVNWLLDDHTTQYWSVFTNSFVATDVTTTLRFSALGPGTMGNFIDAVQVSSVPTLAIAIAAVPAPASIAAFGMGLLALAGVRRSRRKA